MLFIAFSYSASSLAGPLGITDDRNVKDILNRARAVLSQLVSEAGNESRVTLTHLFRLMLMLETKIDEDVRNQIDGVFKNLQKTQKELFWDLDRLLEETQKDLVNPAIDRVDKRIEHAEAMLVRLAPWATGEPGVLGYSPASFSIKAIRDRNERSLRLSIRGVNLYKADKSFDVKLQLQGTAIRLGPDATGENELVFLIPLEHLQIQPDRIDYVRAELQYRTKGMFGISKEPKYRFSLLLATWPAVVATVELEQRVIDEKKEIRWLFSCTKNSHGADQQWTSDLENPGEEALMENCPPYILGGPEYRQSWHEVKLCVYRSDGWTLETDTHRIHKGPSPRAWFLCKGDQPDGRYNQDAYFKPVSGELSQERVCYVVATNGGQKGHCYETTGQFKLRETRVVKSPSTLRSGPSDLGIGQSISFDVKSQDPSIRVKFLDGSVNSYPSNIRKIGPVRVHWNQDRSKVFLDAPDEILLNK
ncbi:MAG: hypothetical protein E6R14_08965 [Thermomicrobiales bacterium]|nr:MAG: hypothetical protein E6R14_08965 [Thermomicrobiales bacterium]